MTERLHQMLENMDISEAKPEDAAELTDIEKEGWLEAFLRPEIGITEEFVEWRFSGAQREKRVAMMTEAIQKDLSKFLVVRVGSHIAGFLSYTEGSDHAFFESFFVRRQYRGLGAALIQRVRKEVDLSKDSFANVVAYNEPAQALYRLLGFRAESAGFTRPLEGPMGTVNQPMIRMVRHASGSPDLTVQ